MKYSVLIVLLGALMAQSAHSEVRVWEGTLVLPTSEEGPPDPNPPFDVFATTRFNYPYTLRENLTGKSSDVAWRAIYLENEYLKCSVLPDLGGHLYSCLDKISNQPVFYANPSIKKARIGYRGAWAAYGIEFNFPVSHNWLSMSPVQYALSKHEDGSASAYVHAIDRVYGMQWQVELVLRAGSTVLEQHVSLNNRSDVRHRFYWWSNAGVEVWDDSKIWYPMRYAASHGFTMVETWPVDSSGIDMSVIANQKKGPVSMFVHGSREPFMGVYHPRTNTGVVHYADYAELPAKKIWSWGVDADGLDWRRALSDNNSAYVEVQAGLFRNQETYAFLEPRQTIHFTEYWMPVRGIGGIARANLAGVLNLSRKDGQLTASLNANRSIPGARLRILKGSTVLYEETADLVPEKTWSHSVPAPDGGACRFELLDSAGSILLAQTEGVYDWVPDSEITKGPQPNLGPSATRTDSEDNFVELGKDQELNGRLLEAQQTYRQGLGRFPNSFALRVALGRLAAALMRYQEAVAQLELAQAQATYDPQIAYYLGVGYDGLGQVPKARIAFEAAHRMPSYRAAGSVRLAELSARAGHLPEAAGYLEAALQSAPGDLRTAEELYAVYVALDRGRDAEALKSKWLRLYPASAFLSGQTGSDPDRVLNIAGLYMRLGLWRPAIDVLSKKYPAIPPEQAEPGALLPQDHQIVAYYRGYCREKLGESGKSEYSAASKLSTAYVFPWGPQTFEVLQAVAKTNPDDATAHFLLGSIHLSTGDTKQAIAEWQTARRLNPKLPVLHANLGRVLLGIENNTPEALAVFREGLGADPMNVELYTGTNRALSLTKAPASERAAVLEKYPDRAGMPAPLVYELALSLAEAGEFDRADALFRDRFFPREEGGTNVREVWLEVRLKRALALAKSRNCSEASNVIAALSAEVPGLYFTRDGLVEILRTPRFESLVAAVQKLCGKTR